MRQGPESRTRTEGGVPGMHVPSLWEAAQPKGGLPLEAVDFPAPEV